MKHLSSECPVLLLCCRVLWSKMQRTKFFHQPKSIGNNSTRALKRKISQKSSRRNKYSHTMHFLRSFWVVASGVGKPGAYILSYSYTVALATFPWRRGILVMDHRTTLSVLTVFWQFVVVLYWLSVCAYEGLFEVLLAAYDWEACATIPLVATPASIGIV